jgi:hypothetical protein
VLAEVMLTLSVGASIAAAFESLAVAKTSIASSCCASTVSSNRPLFVTARPDQVVIPSTNLGTVGILHFIILLLKESLCNPEIPAVSNCRCLY